MATSTTDVNLDERDHDVLRVLAGGRANPYLIREETGLGKGDVNTTLNRLGRGGYVEQTTLGLYEITAKGRREIGAPDDIDAVRDDLTRALEHREWGAVEDALARLEADGE